MLHLNIIYCKYINYFSKKKLNIVNMHRRTRGGASPPPLMRSHFEGGDSWGGSGGILLILHLPQALYILHCIALHSPKLKD